MHRHDQKPVGLVEIGRQNLHRRLRVQRHRRLEPQGPYAPQLRVQIAVRLDVYLQRLRARRGESLQIEVRPRHHQMHVAAKARRRLAGERHHVRPERNVRNEVRIHDIQVQRFGAGCFRTADFGGELSEVGREK